MFKIIIHVMSCLLKTGFGHNQPYQCLCLAYFDRLTLQEAPNNSPIMSDSVVVVSPAARAGETTPCLSCLIQRKYQVFSTVSCTFRGKK